MSTTYEYHSRKTLHSKQLDFSLEPDEGAGFVCVSICQQSQYRKEDTHTEECNYFDYYFRQIEQHKVIPNEDVHN